MVKTIVKQFKNKKHSHRDRVRERDRRVEEPDELNDQRSSLFDKNIDDKGIDELDNDNILSYAEGEEVKEESALNNDFGKGCRDSLGLT